jgi:hypothetical protein
MQSVGSTLHVLSCPRPGVSQAGSADFHPASRSLSSARSALSHGMTHVCSGVGNYNPVLGECICPIGFNGSSCERSALPACRALPESTALSCPVGRPQHCECHAQCVANGAFEAHMYRFCFRGGGGDALSALPAADGEEAASFFERRDSQWVAVPHLTSTYLSTTDRHMHANLTQASRRSRRGMYWAGAALRGAATRVPSGAGARPGQPMPAPLRRARRLSRQGRPPRRPRLLQVRPPLFGQGAL